MQFYNHPFTENRVKDSPIFIGENKVERFVYPENNTDYSDLCAMYLSTEEITVCTVDIGPGGMFDPPDCHPGDEAYYVLEGTVTLLNPAIGQCVEVYEGEAVLIPKGALHSGYNFGEKTAKVLAVIAPEVLEDPAAATNVYGPKKIFKYCAEDFSENCCKWDEPRFYGTIDDLGSWPAKGEDLRKSGFIYPIVERKKLRVINGNTRPVLMKFAVSNDFMHVGEYLLPTGGAVTAHSEAISHGSPSFLFGVDGSMTVFLTKTGSVFVINRYEGIYIPPCTEYQLINYGSRMAKAIFAVAKEL